ncbi:uncharacterized protein [Henckelia pumila]|uniref:uncharacterized protein n=1 Tax=Henckelia pumila TaxID=405737 RepID=UPI003C6E4D02
MADSHTKTVDYETVSAVEAEYEALVIGFEILKDLQAKNIQVIGDLQLVLRQVAGEYKCTSLSLDQYFSAASQLTDDFEEINFQYVPRQQNWEANELSQIASGYWRDELKEALQLPEKSIPYGVRMKVLNVMVEGDLYRKGMDGLLLRCIGFPEEMEVMKQVHEGVCGAHQSGIQMRWIVRTHGYYWPSMLKDCIRYSKGCQPCQKHGNIQRVPADEMYAIVKSWPFRGWAMDLIEKIYPSSSTGHNFIIVATDFFTKWVEEIPLKKDNGQAEASNKVLIQILQKMMEDNPRDCPRLLPETLWAYRTSKRTATGVSPFALSYGHEAVLPIEIMVPSLQIAMQNHLILELYNEAMITELEDLDDMRMQALNSLMHQKEKVAQRYNKRVKKSRSMKEIWFGKSYYLWELRTGNWENGLPIGKDHLKFIEYLMGTLIGWTV